MILGELYSILQVVWVVGAVRIVCTVVPFDDTSVLRQAVVAELVLALDTFCGYG
jgi:hypothetical protein